MRSALWQVLVEYRSVPTLDETRDLLAKAGYSVDDERRTPDGYATQLRLTGGGIVTVYDKGSIVVGGKISEKDKIDALLAARASQPADPATNRVFVVYGHDPTARGDLETLLRRWGLEPIFLDQLPSEGQTIIEKLEKYRAQARFAIVLATPDDEGYRANRPDEKAYRARQNVVLELGMMLAHLGRSHVAILLKDVKNMERPSDIQGLIYIPFTDSVKDASVTLAKEMAQQGFRIDVKKL